MKNLENEYKNMAEAEVPDLWAKINDSLDRIEEPEPVTKPVIHKFPVKKVTKICEILAIAACAVFLTALVINRSLVSKDASQGGYPSAAQNTAKYSTTQEETRNFSEAAESQASTTNAAPAKAEVCEECTLPDEDSLLKEKSFSNTLVTGSEDEISESFDENVPGYFFNDQYYDLKLVLYGLDGDDFVSFIVLTNIPDITFEDVLAFYKSDNPEALFSESDLLIIDVTTE